MNKLTADKCREQFEEWAINQCAYDLTYSDATKQNYRSMKTKAAWRVWQASRNALPILEQQERGEWIEWKGGDQPVSDYAVVEVKLRNGSVYKGEFANCYEWNHGYRDLSTTEVDIIAYRIIPDRATNQNGEGHD